MIGHSCPLTRTTICTSVFIKPCWTLFLTVTNTATLPDTVQVWYLQARIGLTTCPSAWPRKVAEALWATCLCTPCHGGHEGYIGIVARGYAAQECDFDELYDFAEFKWRSEWADAGAYCEHDDASVCWSRTTECRRGVLGSSICCLIYHQKKSRRLSRIARSHRVRWAQSTRKTSCIGDCHWLCGPTWGCQCDLSKSPRTWTNWCGHA